MTIHLPKDLETFVHDAVRAGCYASDDDVIRDALVRLRQAMADHQKKPMTEEEFKQQLIEAGMMTSLPTPADPAQRRDFRPVPIEGEPLSETILRERR